MGGVSLPGGGGKRALDFELNLVPFIDLLSCCISFLLITAAWTQLSRIETTQKPDPPGAAAQPDQKRNRIEIQVDEAGFKLLGPDDITFTPIGRDGTKYAYKALETKLRTFRARYPAIITVFVIGADKVPYKEIVQTMDLCVQVGLKTITLRSVDPSVPGAGG